MRCSTRATCGGRRLALDNTPEHATRTKAASLELPERASSMEGKPEAGQSRQMPDPASHR
mgnify:CR=1 FL=1